MEYRVAIKENEIILFAVTWIDLEMVKASLVAQMVKTLPAMWETWVQSLSREDLLEKEMATHSNTFVWKIPRMEDPGGYSPWGRKELDTTERLHFTSLHFLYLFFF